MTTQRTLYRNGDTIIAPASAVGGGVAVVRISGPSCKAVLVALGVDAALLAPRQAQLKTLRVGGTALDHALVLSFPAPHSFTGEDVAELHTHGSPAVVNAVLEAATALEGVRLAEPGEFSRRAVANGKMDITQAEGLADLVAAHTEAQRRQALAQLDGALGTRFEAWRSRLIHLLAQVEAGIDFPDEELEVLQAPALQKGLQDLLANLNAALEEKGGERIRSGIRLAIVGAPNAGKSTLLNLLAGADVAITSPTAGTTRDVVTKLLDIGGYPVEIADTAGLRADTGDAIEAEGIRRARRQAAQADVVVWVIPAAQWVKGRLDDGAALLAAGRGLVVFSKADETPKADIGHTVQVEDESYPAVAADLTDPAAFRRLAAALAPVLRGVAHTSAEAATLTRKRHRAAAEEAVAAIGRALVLVNRAGQGGDALAELVAEELRQAAQAVGSVTGRTDTETVLDEVFSTFCIGK